MAGKLRQPEIECCEEHSIHTGAVCLARQAMPCEEVTSAASDFFKAFSDKTRLRILTALSAEELCVCDIADTKLFSAECRQDTQARFVRKSLEKVRSG